MNQECQFWSGAPCRARHSFMNTRLFSSLFQQGAWPKATDSPRQRAFQSFPSHSGKPNKSSLGQCSQNFQEHNPNCSTQSGESHRLPPLKHHWKYTHMLYAWIQACTWASTLSQNGAGDATALQEQPWHAHTSRCQGRHPARLCLRLCLNIKKIQFWFQLQRSFFQLYHPTLRQKVSIFKTVSKLNTNAYTAETPEPCSAINVLTFPELVWNFNCLI